MRTSTFLAIAASLASANAQYLGFNYGATNADGYSIRTQESFQALFANAKALAGTNGEFTAARLYTTIQAGTTNSPTGAIPAAIAEGTHLLLGLWASGPIENELIALKAAIAQYGTAFTSLVGGISVGSEDLYRQSPTGVAAGSNIGAEPATIVDYISQVRALIAGTGLSGVPVGHVDTWTAWANSSNSAVVEASDFLGVDAYPYFQDTESNAVEDGEKLFQAALDQTTAFGKGKEIWITETGWPVVGKTRNLAVANKENAKKYWDLVGCPRFGKVNMFWYTQEDNDGGATPAEEFGVTSGNPLSSTPYYDLSCSNVSVSSSSSSSASSSKTATGGSASATDASATTSAGSAAGTAVVSSGGSLSPSQGAGTGYGSGSNATTTGGSSSGGSSSSNGTLSTTLKPTGSATGTGSAPSATSVTQSGASAITVGSASLMAVLVAAFAAL